MAGDVPTRVRGSKCRLFPWTGPTKEVAGFAKRGRSPGSRSSMGPVFPGFFTGSSLQITEPMIVLGLYNGSGD